MIIMQYKDCHGRSPWSIIRSTALREGMSLDLSVQGIIEHTPVPVPLLACSGTEVGVAMLLRDKGSLTVASSDATHAAVALQTEQSLLLSPSKE
jgi:hypothetical protein